MKWITATQLEAWANSIDSRTALSELVSALVRASAIEIQNFHFPTGDSAQIQGYDGSLTAIGTPPYVPDGDSVWEFGVNADYLKKANDDYTARTNSPDRATLASSTFIFVTARRWASGKTTLPDWEADKRSEGKWKDVRALDAVALEDWLSQRPAVAARLARYVLKLVPPVGARSTDEFWDEYSARFKPRLTEKVVLCGREKQAEELLSTLSKNAGDILWRADSPDEVVAFVVAAIRNADAEVRQFLESRTLILDSEDAARQLGTLTPLILVPRGTALSLAGWLAQQNPTIVALGTEAISRKEAQPLNRPTSYELGKAIESMGLPEDQAMQLARASGRSITILERRIPSATAPSPKWLKDGTLLIPALLAGGWDSNSAHDQAIVAKLAGKASYAEYEKSLLPLSKLPDPPIDREGSVWKIRAPVDAFAHLAGIVAESDLTLLRDVSKEIFGEEDPALDLPEKDRPFASLRGKQLKHSGWLRDGLATTLLQISVFGDDAGLVIRGTTCQAYVESVIGELPGLDRDYRLIASIRGRLQLLMEAAPRPLLLALERMLEGDGEKIKPIFSEGDSILGPGSPHTDVLWALEVLAWDPAYLLRASLVLAKLARIDPGGKLSNRPINSLQDIFLYWRPHTYAPLAQRLATIDYLIERESQVAWELLVKLLPSGHSHTTGTAKPRYREAGASDSEVLTWGIVHEAARAIIDRAIALAGSDSSRWTVIVKGLPNFDPARGESALKQLESQLAGWTSEQRKIVWAVARDEASRHRAFPTADWSMKEPYISELERIASLLKPTDIKASIAWLFNEHYPSSLITAKEGKRDAVEEARENAIRKLHDEAGRNGVTELVSEVEYPQFVAHALSPLLQSIDEFENYVVNTLGQGQRFDMFSLALSGEAERRYEKDWPELVALMVNRFPPEQIATLVLGWRDDRKAWDFVDAQGEAMSDAYWKRIHIWSIRGGVDDAEFAARKLVKMRRAAAALEAIHRHVSSISFPLMLEVLDASIKEINEETFNVTSMFLHHVGEIFSKLSARTDIDLTELARREYAYLPILRHREKEDLVLHRLMTEDAAFYVSILSDVFRASQAEPSEPTPEKRNRAHLGYDLLSTLKTLPGQEGTAINAQKLNEWVSKVRQLAVEADRETIADQHIGHLLAHAPADPEDSTWPHRTIRQLIEHVASEQIEKGIGIERHNMRGVYSKALYEGGKQERALAQRYREWAKAAVQWPRTATLLHEIAKDWDHQAEREDEQARQQQMHE